MEVSRMKSPHQGHVTMNGKDKIEPWTTHTDGRSPPTLTRRLQRDSTTLPIKNSIYFPTLSSSWLQDSLGPQRSTRDTMWSEPRCQSLCSFLAHVSGMLLPPHKAVGSEDEKSHGKRSPAARQHSLPDRREAILKPSSQVEPPDNSSHRSDLRKTSRRCPVLSIREAPRCHPTCKLTS